MKLPSDFRCLKVSEVQLGDFFLCESGESVKDLVVGMKVGRPIAEEGMIILFKKGPGTNAELYRADPLYLEDAILFTKEIELKLDYKFEDWEMSANDPDVANLELIAAPRRIEEDDYKTEYYLGVNAKLENNPRSTKLYINLQNNTYLNRLPQNSVKIKKWQIGFKVDDEFKSILASD